MAIYLKKFENHSQYAAYTADTANFILPNVSICTTEGDVHYNPSSPVPPIPTYEYIDLGLPSGTLWAKYNVGATSETEYGNYYQYGKGADNFTVTSGQSDYEGTESPLATSADTAAQVWGGNWHMPTSAQCQELTANTTYEWTTINGVNGCKFTATNGNYVFFPAAGYYDNNGNLSYEGNGGFIWTSTPYEINDPRAYYFYLVNLGSVIGRGCDITDYNAGHSVRPVVG